MTEVSIGPLTVGNDRPLTVIAGPCQIESLDHALMIAERMAQICAAAGAGYVFKASYDKANRTSISGQRGVGMDEGLRVLAEVKARIGCPVLTDIHGPDHCAPVAEVVDILQTPLSSAARPTCCWPRARPAPRSTSRRASSLPPGTWPMSRPRSNRPATGGSF